MKQIFTLAALALMAGSAFAVESAFPSYSWGKLFDGNTSAGDQSQNVVVAGDGNVYWHLIGGTTSSARDISYGGSVLFQGAEYEGTSQNGNLCILKTDAEGNVLWKLYSNKGNFAGNAGRVAATSDGGAVFSAKVSGSVAGSLGSINLVDATGRSYPYEFTPNSDDKYYFRVLVGRISPEGTLEWVKMLDPEVTIASGKYVADAVETNGLAIDAQDNIYVAGKYCVPMTLMGTNTKFTPHNSTSWDGNAQAKLGDLYLLKFNINGEYLGNAVTSGVVRDESVVGLSYDNGSLYLQYTIANKGTKATQSFGGKSYNVAGEITPVVVKMDTNFTASWITSLKGEKANNQVAYQNANTSIVNGSVWVTSQTSGSYSDMADASKVVTPQSATREGLLIKLNGETGAWEAGTLSGVDYGVNLTGYFGVLPNFQNDKEVYVYGYGMNSLGIFMRTYDATTLVSDKDSQVVLTTCGAMPTMQSVAYNTKDGLLYLTARSNNEWKMLGGTSIAKGAGWTILTACYNMPKNPGISSAVDAISGDTLTLRGGSGKIIVEGNESAVAVYDLSGRKVAEISPNQQYAAVAPGIYIAAGRKVIVRN
ncbi:MAG: hypothetical protein NC186_03165 [Prevotella sp.]|nr:hypothetical protein [Prevotella sp.]MCM1475525.1 hypothetical protein [Muribaculaceae bacterium]